jgi:hypothetical protein
MSDVAAVNVNGLPLSKSRAEPDSMCAMLFKVSVAALTVAHEFHEDRLCLSGLSSCRLFPSVAPLELLQ